MSWRPDGWENPYNFMTGEPIPKWKGKSESFEEGADALLEALFKLAKESPTGTFVIDSKVVDIYNLIPDDAMPASQIV